MSTVPCVIQVGHRCHEAITRPFLLQIIVVLYCLLPFHMSFFNRIYIVGLVRQLTNLRHKRSGVAPL
jgi:hypothetical protein